ncbi:hypothetical protein LSH36_282g01022 [Paralvinella palmiformis]|uniref:Uncharacterized protein n=1 Tax=Paralvinella palmiformis TaxID=53620 RepID=A0AAD9N228_9ANNE|nr:hypothetical protein LSH36_282g01022 [Paralvinella palmiformis]
MPNRVAQIILQLQSACPEGCKMCTIPAESVTTICEYEACLEYYSYNTSSFMCAACPSNCLTCLSGGDNDMLCDACDTSYSLYIGCTGCPSSCDSCSMTTYGLSCSKCSNGYALYSGSPGITYCTACSWLLPGCLSCETNSEGLLLCLKCASGFTLSVGGTECYYCVTIPLCLSCFYDGLICQICDSGYLLEAGRCTRGCYSCADNTTSDGYASYQQCGRHISKTTYDLVSCPNGSCWATTRVIGNDTTYQRSCSATACSSTYRYRVCSQSLGTNILVRNTTYGSVFISMITRDKGQWLTKQTLA